MLVVFGAVRAKAFFLQVIESSHVFEQRNICFLVANRNDFQCEVRYRQMCVCACQALTIRNKVWVVLWQVIVFKLIPDSVVVDITISVLRLPFDCFCIFTFSDVHQPRSENVLLQATDILHCCEQRCRRRKFVFCIR